MSDFTKIVAGACVAATLAVAGAPAQAVTLINGGFDMVGTTSPTKGKVNGNALADMPGKSGNKSWDVFDIIPGWRAGSGEAGIEIQTINTITGANAITPHSGDYYVELDSDRGSNSGTTNSSMFQTVRLNAGQYLLDFYYSPRVNSLGTNGIAFGVQGVGGGASVLTGLVDGPSAGPVATSVGSWTLISTMFNVGVTGDYDLFFRAVGTDDSFGGFIDSVSLSVVPAPVGIVLLPFGFAAMHLVGRRRRAA